MNLQAVMFDLDGTLADTLADIAAAGNHVRQSHGHGPLPVARYRYLAGQGVAYLVRHALELNGDGEGDTDVAAQVDEGVTCFRRYYAQHKYDQTGPFPTIPALLDELTGRQVPLAVLSNKPHDATVEVVEHLFARWPWAAVRGHREPAPLKPDPQSALAIAEQLQIAPERWLYVGDTKADMLTGKAAGFFTVGVTWGFRDEPELLANGADAIVHEPGEILALLDSAVTQG